MEQRPNVYGKTAALAGKIMPKTMDEKAHTRVPKL
jgi:hypothetical protein